MLLAPNDAHNAVSDVNSCFLMRQRGNVCVMRSGCSRSRPALEECRAHSLGDASPALTSQSASIWSRKKPAGVELPESWFWALLELKGLDLSSPCFINQSRSGQPACCQMFAMVLLTADWMETVVYLMRAGEGEKGTKRSSLYFKQRTKSQTQTHSPPVLLWACI